MRTPVDVDPTVGLTGVDVLDVTLLAAHTRPFGTREQIERAPRRYVTSGGRVVAETATRTTLHVP